MKRSMKIRSQAGFLSLHVLVPAVLVIASIAGIGAYVLTTSHAAPGPIVSGSTSPCGSLHRNSEVWNLTYNTSLKDSDSVRNISYELCSRGLISASYSRAIDKSGNWTQTIQNALAGYQRTTSPLQGLPDGKPGPKTVCSLGLVPKGWGTVDCGALLISSGKR